MKSVQSLILELAISSKQIAFKIPFRKHCPFNLVINISGEIQTCGYDRGGVGFSGGCFRSAVTISPESEPFPWERGEKPAL